LLVFCAGVVPIAVSPLSQLNDHLARGLHSWVEMMAELPGGHWKKEPWVSGERVVVYSMPYGASAVYLGLGGGCLLDSASEYSFKQFVHPSIKNLQIDSVILSHADSQHCGGLPSVITDYPVKQIALPTMQGRSSSYKRAVMLAEEGGVALRLMEAGMILELDADARLEVLANDQLGAVADDHCLVLLLVWRDQRILFLNDSGFLVEQLLRERNPGFHADIIVLGDHARDLGPSAEWLESMNPRLVVTEKPRVDLKGVRQHVLSEHGAWSLSFDDSTWEECQYRND